MSEDTVTDFEKGGRPGKGSAPFPATMAQLAQRSTSTSHCLVTLRDCDSSTVFWLCDVSS